MLKRRFVQFGKKLSREINIFVAAEFLPQAEFIVHVIASGSRAKDYSTTLLWHYGIVGKLKGSGSTQ